MLSFRTSRGTIGPDGCPPSRVARRKDHLNSDFFIVAKPIPVAPNELPT